MPTEIHYPNSNRVGKFRILFEMLREGRELCGALFALCVMLSVEDHESGRGLHYIAAAPLFEPLAEGEEIPEYRIEAAPPGARFETVEHEAAAVGAPGAWRFVAIRQLVVRVPPLAVGIEAHGTRH